MRAKVTGMRFGGPDEVAKYIALVRQNPAAYHCDRCILCAKRADRLGVFSPNPEQHAKFGGLPGKERCVLYGLCGACAKLDGFVDRIEEQLLEDINANH